MSDVEICLKETVKLLTQMAIVCPEIKELPTYKTIWRNLRWCIGTVVDQNRAFMTHDELLKFNHTLEQIRNGGT